MAKIRLLPLTRTARIMLALQIWSTTRQKWDNLLSDVPSVSFDELGIPFQYPLIMDLREQGILHLTSTRDGSCGVALERMYAELTMPEFHAEIKRLNP